MRFREVLVVGGLVLTAACTDTTVVTDGGQKVKQAKLNLTTNNSDGQATTPQPKEPTVCRVISATGPIHQADAADGGVVASGEVAGDSFFTIGAGGRLAIKNGKTTRETIFEGGGDVRVCVNGDEEMWMTTGLFSSVVGAGESPGAEVWIVMPQGVVRYGSGARLHVNVGVKAEVQLQNGGAFVYPVDAIATSRDAEAPHGTDGWYPAPVGTLTLTSKKAPSQILGDCEQAAKAAHDLAVQIETRDASLAEAAPRHVVLRQRAHALCSVAELVAARSFDLGERERLLPRAHAAAAKWRDVAVAN